MLRIATWGFSPNVPRYVCNVDIPAALSLSIPVPRLAALRECMCAALSQPWRQVYPGAVMSYVCNLEKQQESHNNLVEYKDVGTDV